MLTELSDTQLRITNFHTRWNIELSDADRWSNFKNRVMNAYSSSKDLTSFGNLILDSARSEEEFFKLLGVHLKGGKNVFQFSDYYSRELIESPTYNYLLEADDMKKFLLAIEALYWMKEINHAFLKEIKYAFLKEIKDAIVITAVPIVVTKNQSNILFYPAGAKLLDDKLVNDNLKWLAIYPKSYELFKIVLSELGVKEKERNVMDNLRLSLEILLKEILKNDKSLENQKNALGTYLKEKQTSDHIRELYTTVLNYFCKYQNDNAKHSNNAQADDVEFILYLTGTLIRFLLTK